MYEIAKYKNELCIFCTNSRTYIFCRELNNKNNKRKLLLQKIKELEKVKD